MEPEHFDSVHKFAGKMRDILPPSDQGSSEEAAAALAQRDIQVRTLLRIAEQLAGIHDALIRLESTIRMIGVHLQERK